MGHLTGLLVFFASYLLFGGINLIQFSEKLLDSSENVRLVHVIGLSGAGVTFGAAFVGFIVALTKRKMPAAAKTPAQEQPAL
jgi:hypothetical protein